ncbi:MAG: 50S ribosomal protein L5 [Nitrospirae bacterium]|nr:50S ribosomal protein L5 [Nitrospirota bacterium]
MAKKETVTKDAVVKKESAPRKEAVAAKKEPNYIKIKFSKEVTPALMSEFSFKSVMQVPRLEKIVINVGMGEAISNMKLLDEAAKELGMITGQKPVITKSKKSIAGFKLREGMPIGCKVTLRGERMYEFFHRLLHAALPRIRDFRGVSTKSFDGRGSYTLGVKEQLIFPEIKYDEIAALHGMDITIVTTAKNDDQGRALLRHLGMPFRK